MQAQMSLNSSLNYYITAVGLHHLTLLLASCLRHLLQSYHSLSFLPSLLLRSLPVLVSLTLGNQFCAQSHTRARATVGPAGPATPPVLPHPLVTVKGFTVHHLSTFAYNIISNSVVQCEQLIVIMEVAIVVTPASTPVTASDASDGTGGQL
jgi:hypothetical protein